MKNMKKYNIIPVNIILVIGFIVSSSISSNAQIGPNHKGGSKEGREKIIQMKVAYIRENLGLTEAENKKFLPIYEEDLKKEEALRQKQRGIMRNVKNTYKEMADADIEKSLTDEMLIEQQMLDLKKVQFEAYKKLIPIKKVVELKVTERAFNKMLMEKLRANKPGMQEPPDEK
jgi:hypothetical protein